MGAKAGLTYLIFNMLPFRLDPVSEVQNLQLSYSFKFSKHTSENAISYIAILVSVS